jgi:FkbM family methyltransferase
MIHGQDLFLLPADGYSKTLFLYRRQHFALLAGIARLGFSRGEEVFAVDVGANVGYVSCSISQRSDISNVYSFEPNQVAFSFLAKNATDKMECENLLVSNTTGKAKLLLNEVNSAWSGPKSTNMRGARSVEVDSVTLDGYFEKNRLRGARCGLIKIDVEGSEASVLEGALSLIARDNPVLVVERNHNVATLDRLLGEILRGGRYGLFQVDDNGFLNQTTLAAADYELNDVLLVPEWVSIRT